MNLRSMLILCICVLAAACANDTPAATLAAANSNKGSQDAAISSDDAIAATDSTSAPDTSTPETIAPECKVSADCPGAKELCVAGSCQPQTECASDKQCIAASMVCDQKTGVCVQCLATEDCDGEALCKAHTCVQPPKACFTTKDCDAGMVCDKPNKQCVECIGPEDCPKGLGCFETVCAPMLCSSGKTQCKDSATLQTCAGNGGAWDETSCGSDSVCIAGECAPMVCQPGLAYCAGDQPMQCDKLGTATTKLAACKPGQACMVGQCATSDCTAGQKVCSDNATLATCKTDGSGWDKQACPAGHVCDVNQCKAVVCAPSSKTCAGAQVMQCNAAGTGTAMLADCAKSAQTCKNGACAAGPICTAGDKTCEGIVPMVCKSDGSGWQAGKACADGDACTDDGCDAQKGCTYAQKTCPVDADPCTTDACLAGACTHSPAVEGSACGTGLVCKTGKCVAMGLCTVGTKQCVGNKQLTCKTDGSGWDELLCDDGNVCTADVCIAGAGCASSALAAGSGCGANKQCDGKGLCLDAPSGGPAGMLLIPASTFWMGCNKAKASGCNNEDFPQHKVNLSAYYMDSQEVTMAAYESCVAAKVCLAPADYCTKENMSNWDTPTGKTKVGREQHPANCVGWDQAQNYCKWRGTQMDPANAAKYDLPTEAQWEMAAAGSCEKNGASSSDAMACKVAMRTYPWGEAAPSCTLANFYTSSTGCGTGITLPVGSKPDGISPYGLQDMAGNVSEWVRDAFDQTYYSQSPSSNPTGPAGNTNLRSVRGGSIGGTAPVLRVSARSSVSSSALASAWGFRCVRAE